MSVCNICPRRCSAERDAGELGICGSPDRFSVAKIMLHRWEEPCLVGEMGAGTVFFSGCNLGCVYCQNRKISRGVTGSLMTDSELAREIFALCESGASCIEFVTPTHYTSRLAPLLERIKGRINVPVVYNSGGYDSVESLRRLDGLIDIYMPDFKYFSPELAKKYSNAEDYPTVALEGLREMVRQTGAPRFFENNTELLQSGTIVRHLILPSHRRDSISVLELIAENLGAENIILSLMGQYTPDFFLEYEREKGARDDMKALRRKVTSFEYSSVLSAAQSLGFLGYMQDISSSSAKYTPDF